MDITITTPDGIVQKRTFKGARSISIGRDPTCDIVFDNLDVSRKHVTVEAIAQGWLIVDRSANGTFVGPVVTLP